LEFGIWNLFRMTNLFREFTPSSKSEWLAKVEKDLKGKPLKELEWELNEQLRISPFAHADDLPITHTPLADGRIKNTWEIGVLFQTEQVDTANKEALQALGKGATAIAFDITQRLQLSEIATLLKGIQLEWISVHFIFHQNTWMRFFRNFQAYVKEAGYDLSKVKCSFAYKGNPTDTTGERIVLKEMHQALPQATLFTVDGHQFYKGKEETVEELAAIIEEGNDLLVQLNKEELGIANYYSTLQFSITLGDSYFINIAKIRALKLLWQQVLQAWDDSLTLPPTIEVHLGSASQTGEEHYNKIKATSQAMSAVIGGAQRLYIYPSDATKNKQGTAFAKRIAWNIQHLMQLESYMDRVLDPAAGSYYIESLTDQLAEAAWGEFQGLVG